MNAPYRPGIAIVLGTVLVSLAVCLGSVGERPAPARAGQDLGDHGLPLGHFRLTERSGRVLTDADLADRVWVASFIFTHCPLSCPRISSVMKGLEGRFEGSDVQLVSISVDPERDTPEVLADYARRFNANPDRWWFLTGSKSDVVDLVTGRFKLSLQVNESAEREAGAEAFSHSDRLALVDRGKVAGYFDSTDPSAISALVSQARQRAGRTAPAWARKLPAVNATLNASCALLLALGWALIRTRHVRAHAAVMIACVAVSALFLTSYLVYHFQVGSVPFRGTGPARLAYFTILLSHTILATFGVIPLVALTLVRALRRQFDRHARVARLTFPIWMYVSVTGVIIYVMLYQLPVATSLPASLAP